MRKVFGLAMAVGLGLIMTGANGQSDSLTDALKARIAPVGSVCMTGDDCAAAPVAAAPSGPRTGQEVYQTTCTTCHSIGLAGAPKTGSASDWAPRIAQGIEVLYTHAIEGLNGMPAMGLCANCSEDEIKAAVDYLVDGSK